MNVALEVPFLAQVSGGRGGRALLAEATSGTKAWFWDV